MYFDEILKWERNIMVVDKFLVEYSYILMFVCLVGDDNKIYFDEEYVKIMEFGLVIVLLIFV